MANKSTITYNGTTIATEEREGDFSVTYNGKTIATVGAGVTKTLNCKDKVMLSDVIIGGKTLLCKAMKMATEIVIAVEKGASVGVVLNVEKITSDTYAGSTTYKGEEFILLDIYPKSGGTVNVTYGGLTKTIVDDGTSEEPNAQQVFFGTFNGVSDSVETPSSGILTIEGDCRGFAAGKYKKDKSTNDFSKCVTYVESFGNIEFIPMEGFMYCDKLTIADDAFADCTDLTTIGDYAFKNCNSLTRFTIPQSVTTIGSQAFGTLSVSMTIIVLSTIPPAMSGLSLGAVMDTNIIVPIGCGEIYKTTDSWSKYADKIVEAST